MGLFYALIQLGPPGLSPSPFRRTASSFFTIHVVLDVNLAVDLD